MQGVMTRSWIAWLVALPLAAAGTQVAHAVAYRVAVPDTDARAHELTATGHSYLAYLPLAVAIGAVVVLLGHAAELRRSIGAPRSRRGAPGLWRFAVLAPAIFVCQEFFERLAFAGGSSLQLATTPTFLRGLALQAPFAFAAYLVARALVRAVQHVARLLSAPPPAPDSGHRPRWHCVPTSAPRISARALGYGSRAPPAFLAS
jgi:hypothetical protein